MIVRIVINVCALAVVLSLAAAIYLGETGRQFEIVRAGRAQTVRAKDLATGAAAVMMVNLAAVATGLMAGNWIKLRQIARFPTADAQVLKAEVFSVRSLAADEPMTLWTVALVCAYPWRDNVLEGPVWVYPGEWTREEAARDHLAERVKDGRCTVAINPENPAEAFLLPAAPAGYGAALAVLAGAWGLAAIFCGIAYHIGAFESLYAAVKAWMGAAPFMGR